MVYAGVNLVEDKVLAMLDLKHRSLGHALRKQKKQPKHTSITRVKSKSEFSTQCTAHRYFREAFRGQRVIHRAIENSIPLGGYSFGEDDSEELKAFKRRVNEDIRTAQGKLISKGCVNDDPDYQILWRDTGNYLQGVNLEFKKVGEYASPEQKERHQEIFDNIGIPTEIVRVMDDWLAVIKKYDIPVRIAELF